MRLFRTNFLTLKKKPHLLKKNNFSFKMLNSEKKTITRTMHQPKIVQISTQIKANL